MKSYKVKLNDDLCFYGLFFSLLANIFCRQALCLSYAAKGTSKSGEATIKVMTFMMVMMPMVNSAEDILDTISPLSTVHRSVYPKTQGIIQISLSSGALHVR